MLLRDFVSVAIDACEAPMRTFRVFAHAGSHLALALFDGSYTEGSVNEAIKVKGTECHARKHQPPALSIYDGRRVGSSIAAACLRE